MALQLNQIKEILKSPKNKSNIQKAALHEDRLKFHTVPTLSDNDLSKASSTFLAWVKTLLPADKYEIFLNLFKVPITTNDLTQEIFDSLSRVKESRNQYFNYTFSNESVKDDWLAFKRSILPIDTILKTEGFDRFKSRINSIMVVDMPETKTGKYFEPYFYWLDVELVIDYELKDYEFNWLIFRLSEEYIAVFDDENWRIVQIQGEQVLEIANKPHYLGFCPARTFWTTPIDSTNKFIKLSPITNQLSNIDWFLFYYTSKKNLDLYASYPIYSGYAQECDYHNPQTGESCSNGKLINADGDYVFHGGTIAKCPICSEKNIGGVGSFVEIPAPSEVNGNTDMRNPVQITTVDRNSLDYNVEETERLERIIKEKVVGRGWEPINNQAVNEKQVTSFYDERKNVLMQVKMNFEIAQHWLEHTILKLRYGAQYISSDHNWGDEFFIFTVSELREMYASAKTIGMSDADLDNIYDRILATEHRNNPMLYQRMNLLRKIEPYRNLSKQEVLSLYEKSLVTPEKYILKVDFSNFIERFERENTNILNFGLNLDLQKKLDIINQKLNVYVKERTKNIVKPAGTEVVQ